MKNSGSIINPYPVSIELRLEDVLDELCTQKRFRLETGMIWMNGKYFGSVEHTPLFAEYLRLSGRKK